MKISDAIYNGKTKIKNIIFDWGGVITNLRHDIIIEGFRNIGLEIYKEPDLWKELFIPFEIGKISPTEFRNKIRNYIENNIEDQLIDDIWNSILGDVPAKRWKILEKVSLKYRTFLLSNTNRIHKEYYFRYLHTIYGTDGFAHLFEKMYFSYMLNMRKPDREIFDFVLNNAEIRASETLFIDDLIENIETAQNMGFITIHLKSPLTLADVFAD